MKRRTFLAGAIGALFAPTVPAFQAPEYPIYCHSQIVAADLCGYAPVESYTGKIHQDEIGRYEDFRFVSMKIDPADLERDRRAAEALELRAVLGMTTGRR